eukprot:GHVN01072821.1.p1 GENE.GHVN01072821.1~~GHVN01072821.1.p1  ORF type:complete len:915 (-),score=147.53 GHVN01072821.1:2742-5486(-)
MIEDVRRPYSEMHASGVRAKKNAVVRRRMREAAAKEIEEGFIPPHGKIIVQQPCAPLVSLKDQEMFRQRQERQKAAAAKAYSAEGPTGSGETRGAPSPPLINVVTSEPPTHNTTAQHSSVPLLLDSKNTTPVGMSHTYGGKTAMPRTSMPGPSTSSIGTGVEDVGKIEGIRPSIAYEVHLVTFWSIYSLTQSREILKRITTKGLGILTPRENDLVEFTLEEVTSPFSWCPQRRICDETSGEVSSTDPTADVKEVNEGDTVKARTIRALVSEEYLPLTGLARLLQSMKKGEIAEANLRGKFASRPVLSESLLDVLMSPTKDSNKEEDSANEPTPITEKTSGKENKSSVCVRIALVNFYRRDSIPVSSPSAKEGVIGQMSTLEMREGYTGPRSQFVPEDGCRVIVELSCEAQFKGTKERLKCFLPVKQIQSGDVTSQVLQSPQTSPRSEKAQAEAVGDSSMSTSQGKDSWIGEGLCFNVGSLGVPPWLTALTRKLRLGQLVGAQMPVEVFTFCLDQRLLVSDQGGEVSEPPIMSMEGVEGWNGVWSVNVTPEVAVDTAKKVQWNPSCLEPHEATRQDKSADVRETKTGDHGDEPGSPEEVDVMIRLVTVLFREKDQWALSDVEKVNAIDRLKAQGNILIQANWLSLARDMYRSAHDICRFFELYRSVAYKESKSLPQGAISLGIPGQHPGSGRSAHNAPVENKAAVDASGGQASGMPAQWQTTIAETINAPGERSQDAQRQIRGREVVRKVQPFPKTDAAPGEWKRDVTPTPSPFLRKAPSADAPEKGAAEETARDAPVAVEQVPTEIDERRLTNIFTSIHLNLGAVALKLGDYRECLTESEKALWFHPECGKALYRKGVAQMKLGDATDAITSFQRALKLTPGDSLIQKSLQEATQTAERQTQQFRQSFWSIFNK